MIAMIPLLLLPFIMIGLVLGVCFLIFWICMLVSAIQNKGLTDGEKIGWVLAIIFLHIIAAPLYFFIGWPKRNTPLPPRS
jgi:Phospholipase_D-nuclease N-terminal